MSLPIIKGLTPLLSKEPVKYWEAFSVVDGSCVDNWVAVDEGNTYGEGYYVGIAIFSSDDTLDYQPDGPWRSTTIDTPHPWGNRGPWDNQPHVWPIDQNTGVPPGGMTVSSRAIAGRVDFSWNCCPCPEPVCVNGVCEHPESRRTILKYTDNSHERL